MRMLQRIKTDFKRSEKTFLELIQAPTLQNSRNPVTTAEKTRGRGSCLKPTARYKNISYQSEQKPNPKPRI